MKTKIIYEDQDIMVCHKPANLAVETKNTFQMDMVSELKNYLRQQKGTAGVPYLAVIHRLDQPVEGILVFAKNRESAAALSSSMQKGEMEKLYLAVLYGEPEKKEAVLEDYLKKDEKTNLSYVVAKDTTGAKQARLSYEIIETRQEEGVPVSVARIHLDTGRHHQIRVQFANAGFPLLGDQKYGSKESKEASDELFLGNVQLCAYALSFQHPGTGKRVTYRLEKVPRLMRTQTEKS